MDFWGAVVGGFLGGATQQVGNYEHAEVVETAAAVDAVAQGANDAWNAPVSPEIYIPHVHVDPPSLPQPSLPTFPDGTPMA